jgi:hypothetical protein
VAGATFQELEARKRRLVEENEALREALEKELHAWAGPLAFLGKCARWARANRELLAFLSGLAAVGWLKRIRPVRFLLTPMEWGQRVWWLYRGVRLAGELLKKRTRP